MAIKLPSLRIALNDWLNLLQPPAATQFALKADYQEEWKRLFRLISLILVMVVAILTFSVIGISSSQRAEILEAFIGDTLQQLLYSIIIIALGALLASLYAMFLAPIFKVSISIPQCFFILLFLGLPWIPIVVLVYVFGFIIPILVYPIIIFQYLIFPTIISLRFSQGVFLVSGCKKWLCYASIYTPLIVITILLILYIVQERH